MKQSEITLLGYALLGLLNQKPASGYDLRKIFSETPMANFSDSPGAIYPGLRRLEERKLVRGTIDQRAGLRQRRVLRLAPAGLTELTTWLTQTIGQMDIARRMSELMLRFAFLDGALGHAATLKFLQSLESELRIYIPTLRNFLKRHSAQMPTSGRLALESGVLGYQAQLRWASRAITVYKRKVESQ